MTESGVTIQRTHEYAVVLIEVAMTGELDRTVVPRAGAMLDSALALHPTHLVLDLTRCSFLDASGIALLVQVHDRARAMGGGLTVACPPRLQRILTLIQVDQVLHLTAPSSHQTSSRSSQKGGAP